MSGDNDYPNVDNYPEASFKTPIAPPDVEPDEGDLIYVSYNPFWGQVLAAACMALLQPSTWQGTHDEIVLAQNRANTLLTLLQEPVSVSLVEAPFWDDTNGDDAPAVATPETQDWYGYMEGVNFVDTLAGWVFTAFVASTYGVEGAIQFATTLHNLRLFFRTADAGAIINVLLDGDVFAQVDTYSSTPGLTYVDIVSPGTTLQIVNTGTANPLATPVGGKYLMAVVRKQLSEAEVVPPNVRYDAGCDCVQTTPDAGATWIDNPGADPRTNVAFQRPALTGSNIQCRAAANMTKAIHDSIDAVTNAVNEAQSVTALIAIFVVFMPEIAVLLALVWAVVEAFFTIGTTVIGAAFTTDVYDTLMCIFDCRIAEDGTVDATALGNILTDINAQIGGTVYAVMNYILQTWGYVGLTNAGTSGNAPADCSDCGCHWCMTFDNAHGWGDWQARNGNAQMLGGNWVSIHSGTAELLSVKLLFTSSQVRKVTIHYNADSAPGGFRGIYFNDSASVPAGAGTMLSLTAGEVTFTLNYPITTGYVGMDIDSSVGSNPNTL